MQAKLPDVNAAIVRHRTLALKGFETNDPDLAIVSIESINALLPSIPGGKNYKVEVDTEKYYSLKAETREIECKKCNTQNQLSDVTIFWLELDWFESIVSGDKKHKMWVCLKCKVSNRFNSDDITVTKNGEPYFYQVMPSPPIREGGIRGRMTYLSEFKKWFSIAMPEIESQIGIYRSEYLSQQDSEQELVITEEET